MRVSGRHRLLASCGFILVQALLFCVGPSSSFRVASGGRRAVRALPRAVHIRTRRRRYSPEGCRAARQAAGLDQDSTPLVDALANAAKNVRSPLFYPGHKMGRQVLLFEASTVVVQSAGSTLRVSANFGGKYSGKLGYSRIFTYLRLLWGGTRVPV